MTNSKGAVMLRCNSTIRKTTVKISIKIYQKYHKTRCQKNDQNQSIKMRGGYQNG